MITKLPRHFFRRVLSEWQRGGDHHYDPHFLCNSPTFRTIWNTRDGYDYITTLAQRYLDHRRTGETTYGTPYIGTMTLFCAVAGGQRSRLRADFLRWCAAHSNNRTITPK